MITTTTQQVREWLTGCSLRFHWWDPARTFSREALERTAQTFSARSRMVKAKLDITDRKEEIFSQLTQLKGAIRSFWVWNTFPYVLDGVRLIPREGYPEIRDKIQREYNKQASKLSVQYEEKRPRLIVQAREDLGELFDASLYPYSWEGLFVAEIEERSIEPPSYLMHSNAEEYAQQLAKRQAEIGASLERFEAEMWQRLFTLTERFQSMLEPAEDGAPKRISAANVDGFRDLFDRAAKLNFQGTRVFQTCLAEFKGILEGITPQELREQRGLRQELREQVQEAVSKFEPLRQRAQQTVDYTEEPDEALQPA